MDDKRFGKQNQKRNGQLAKGRNKFRIKRNTVNDSNSFRNNQVRRRNMSNIVLKKDPNPGRRRRLAQKMADLKRFEAAVGSKRSSAANNQIRQRLASRQMAQGVKRHTKTPAVEKNAKLKLFTKTFDARRKIEAKRMYDGKRGTDTVKADSKAKLAESREQMRHAALAQKREMSFIGNQMKIISKVQAEEERKASFTGTSLKVTTLQTDADRLKHRKAMQSGDSFLITAKQSANDPIDVVSDYSQFEARRKAAHSTKPSSGNGHARLPSLNPISRPTNIQPSHLAEVESNHHTSPSSKISIANLHSNVTHDDIYELFSAVAPLKSARLTRHGVAEVVYYHPEHAVAAYKKYHGRNLDGQPMLCKMIPLEQPVYSPPSSRLHRGSAIVPPKSPSNRSAVVFTVKI